MDLNAFFLAAGFILGVVFSVTMVPGAVWCVQITLARGFISGLAAGLAIGLAQILWAGLAAGALFSLHGYGNSWDPAYRVYAVGVLGYMGFSVWSARPIVSIHYEGPLRGSLAIFRRTLGIALTMPMRLPGYMALLIAASAHYRPYGLGNAGLVGIGAGIGSFSWWFYFILLAALFGRRVPEPITLKSMNKLNFLSAIIFLALATICMLAFAFKIFYNPAGLIK